MQNLEDLGNAEPPRAEADEPWRALAAPLLVLVHGEVLPPLAHQPRWPSSAFLAVVDDVSREVRREVGDGAEVVVDGAAAVAL